VLVDSTYSVRLKMVRSERHQLCSSTLAADGVSCSFDTALTKFGLRNKDLSELYGPPLSHNT